jgi:hypothetical protein
MFLQVFEVWFKVLIILLVSYAYEFCMILQLVLRVHDLRFYFPFLILCKISILTTLDEMELKFVWQACGMFLMAVMVTLSFQCPFIDLWFMDTVCSKIIFRFSCESGQGASEGKRALYHCNYCNKDITGKIRIKCAMCPDFDLCIECFSVGAEVQPHKSNHPYRVMVSKC